MDLTGVWRGINDGSYYFIRQVGNEIWWLGALGGLKFLDATWANVAHGTVSGNVVNLEWADVPLGKNKGSGTFTLNIQLNPDRLTRSGKGFSTVTWERFTGNFWA